VTARHQSGRSGRAAKPDGARSHGRDSGDSADAADGVEQFEAERAGLAGLAYRLTGSLADAEDVVQETWVRWQLADRSTIERPAAWLTTVASRIGLDRLRSRQRERAEYVGPWLPEPLVIGADHTDPAHAAELSDSLTTVFLLVLEQLEPVERLVVLLADVFDQPFSAVAEVTGKAEPACRQIAVRARRKIRSTGSGHVPSGGADARRLANGFAAAALTGDVPALLKLLAPTVVLVSDGGRERHAARRPVVGPARVSRFLVNVTKRLPPDCTFEAVWVNGAPGVIVRSGGELLFLQSIHVSGGQIERIELIVSPAKLAVLDRRPRLAVR
jgi:RNA polymerase sigma-70 factor (ECF subfamily)